MFFNGVALFLFNMLCGVSISFSYLRKLPNFMNRKIRSKGIRVDENLEINSLKAVDLDILVVFDLDACLWLPEMYTLDRIPTPENKIMGNLCDKGVGCVGVSSGYETIRLFPDALAILQDIYLDKYKGMKCAIASSADTPLATKIAHSALSLLEIVPGITMRDAFQKGWQADFDGNIQIGRSPPLSSSKATAHFPILSRLTNYSYDKMIYFDDCLWDDHCANVEQKCPGVVTQRTPRGLRRIDWNNCLRSYEQRYNISVH